MQFIAQVDPMIDELQQVISALSENVLSEDTSLTSSDQLKIRIILAIRDLFTKVNNIRSQQLYNLYNIAQLGTQIPNIYTSSTSLAPKATFQCPDYNHQVRDLIAPLSNGSLCYQYRQFRERVDPMIDKLRSENSLSKNESLTLSDRIKFAIHCLLATIYNSRNEVRQNNYHLTLGPCLKTLYNGHYEITLNEVIEYTEDCTGRVFIFHQYSPPQDISTQSPSVEQTRPQSSRPREKSQSTVQHRAADLRPPHLDQLLPKAYRGQQEIDELEVILKNAKRLKREACKGDSANKNFKGEIPSLISVLEIINQMKSLKAGDHFEIEQVVLSGINISRTTIYKVFRFLRNNGYLIKEDIEKRSTQILFVTGKLKNLITAIETELENSDAECGENATKRGAPQQLDSVDHRPRKQLKKSRPEKRYREIESNFRS